MIKRETLSHQNYIVLNSPSFVMDWNNVIEMLLIRITGGLYSVNSKSLTSTQMGLH